MYHETPDINQREIIQLDQLAARVAEISNDLKVTKPQFSRSSELPHALSPVHVVASKVRLEEVSAHSQLNNEPDKKLFSPFATSIISASDILNSFTASQEELSAPSFPIETPPNQLYPQTNNYRLVFDDIKTSNAHTIWPLTIDGETHTIQMTEKNIHTQDTYLTLLTLTEQENPEAEYLLSNLLFRGNAFKKDLTLSLKLLKKSAEKNFVDALYVLASAYAKGSRGLKRNDSKALKWALLAAEQNDLDTMNLLGVLFERKEDFESAFKYYMLAAEGKKHAAEYNVGRYLAHGRAVPIDLKLAMDYFERSCFGNYADGCFNLANVRHHLYPSEYSVSDKNLLIAYAARLGSSVAIDECKVLEISY
jgi:TPR repeat protein